LFYYEFSKKNHCSFSKLWEGLENGTSQDTCLFDFNNAFAIKSTC